VSLDLARTAGLARADLLERSRRPAFLVLLGAGLWATWVFTPPNHSAYATFRLADSRGIYGSAWIGSTVAMLTAVFFSLAGFYVVKNAIAGDRATRVGSVLAATPMRNVEYMLGKWLSSSAMLGVMTAVMLVGAAVMQLVRGEDTRLMPLVLAAPFLWVALPAMAITAAVAVIFEATPGLRGGAGNIVYFFAWTSALASTDPALTGSAAFWDPLGIRLLVSQMRSAGLAAVPAFAADPGSYSVGLNFKTGGWHLTTFAWDGVDWTLARVLPRIGWFAAAAVLAALAAIPFDRFAEEGGARGTRRRRKSAAAGAERGGDSQAGAGEDASFAVGVEGSPGAVVAAGAVGAAFAAGAGAVNTALSPASIAPRTAVVRGSWAGLAPVARGFSGVALALAEMRLLVAGSSPWWWISWLGLQLPAVLAPIDVASRFAAIGWIWPVLRWSALGARDRVHGTTALLDASPHPIVRQLPAALAAGAALGLVAGAGFGLRALAAGQVPIVAGWLIGAVFVPALAIALGTLTGGRKTFEIVFVVLWYAGPLNGAAPVDFTGASGGAYNAWVALAAVALLLIAALARLRRLAGG
jgi:hypothetical protein